jgi:hypothetical protein
MPTLVKVGKYVAPERLDETECTRNTKGKVGKNR